MTLNTNRQSDADMVAVHMGIDPIEQQILAAGNLSDAQVEAIRGFQRRKGLTFGEAAITLGLVRRDSLFLALTGPLSQGKNAFAVIGAHAGVGATYFAANLALSFAQMAVPTLLIDTNLRKPRLSSLFGVDPKTEGLVEALLRSTLCQAFLCWWPAPRRPTHRS
jgi:Mrp family chromosome partitioning ATPase